MYGKISYPTFNSSTTSNQYLYVNKRSIKDKKILGAIKASYSETIPKGRFPFVIIFLEISPSLVDVNVHPSKTEVRFENDRAISGIIVSSIRSAISESVKSVSKNFEKNFNFINIDSNNLISNNIKPDLKKSEETLKDQIKFNEITNLEPSAKYKENSNFQASLDYPMGAARAQFLKNYIISETKDGIVIVDQHAAHERIVKEEMLQNLKNKKILSQILLIPEIVKLSSLHLDMILDNHKIFESAGFEVEIFGDDAVLVRAIPDILSGDNIQELIRDVAQELFEIGSQNSIDQKIDTIISTSSCYGSVRSGRDLSIEEMNALLRKMEITPNSNQCNHGRPTSIKLSLKDIEKLFKRR